MPNTFHQLLQGHIAPEQKTASDYFYVPFVLPGTARHLSVRYSYSAPMSSAQVEGGNVIDIGLFDPRGNSFPGGAGFRGWSGSARSEFSITPTEATPGYLPGPLPAGEYQIILGLYRIWAVGAEYEIVVHAELDDDAPTTFPQTEAPPAPPAERRAESATSHWLRGDLQSHTYHSDAKGSPEQLVAKARALGLDFLAITDHNTISHHPHLPALANEDLLLLHGQEVTTYYGHMNVWQAQSWCDFRCRTAADMRALIDRAHAHGGICSINHPKDGGPAWEYGFELPTDTMEVWQGPWPYRNDESLALWDRLLLAGKQVRVVGGSDYHCPAGEETNLLRLGQPTTWVQAHERSHAGVLEAIRAGRCTISAQPDGARLALAAAVTDDPTRRAHMGETLALPAAAPVTVRVTVWNGVGLTLQLIVDGQVEATQQIEAADEEIIFTASPQIYVRAELVGDVAPAERPENLSVDVDWRGWRWALSNPIFINTGESA